MNLQGYSVANASIAGDQALAWLSPTTTIVRRARGSPNVHVRSGGGAVASWAAMQSLVVNGKSSGAALSEGVTSVGSLVSLTAAASASSTARSPGAAVTACAGPAPPGRYTRSLTSIVLPIDTATRTAPSARPNRALRTSREAALIGCSTR